MIASNVEINLSATPALITHECCSLRVYVGLSSPEIETAAQGTDP